jgi:predicted ABC-class ATPase
MRALARKLESIDGRGYKAYKDLQGGRFEFPDFRLAIDHVQGDPFAAPSRLRALVPHATADLPPSALGTAARRRATRDLLVRRFHRAAHAEREIAIDVGGQTVLDHSGCLIIEQGIELRFVVNLPAAGRRILGHRARDLLVDRLPEIIAHSVLAANIDPAELERHIAVVEDQVALREQLADASLVAFVGNGAVLPRRTGVDDRPMEDAVPFASPASLEVTLETPNGGPQTGMGVPTGITLVVGGGFHGKSTLLRALETGVWDHVPDDGRECVVSDPGTVKIRAEDGRSVSGVDISDFIDNLPHRASTSNFSTELASGSTSQAAALVEAIEAGAVALLLDEDTSATNFMIRDRRMQALVEKSKEPITPFVDRVRELRDCLGVSTVLVMGGSGDYFDHADTVLQMDAYRPLDVTPAAHEIARRHPSGRSEEHGVALRPVKPRRLVAGSVDPERKRGRVKIQARGTQTLILGRSDIDLRAVDQLSHPSQVRTIGWMLARLAERGDSEPRIVIEDMLGRIRSGEWGWLTGRTDGDLALPRVHEVMAALNRLRGVDFR